MLEQMAAEKGMTKYQLSKKSGVPWATISDICSGKSELRKCTAETVYKLAKALDTTVEGLLDAAAMDAIRQEGRLSFELFRSQVCHRVKEKGDIDWMIYILQTDEIRILFERQWYPEAFYNLAMLDYLSRLHNIERCANYDDIRSCKLKETIYPAYVSLMAKRKKNTKELKELKERAIPEFLHFNIVEPEVRDIV